MQPTPFLRPTALQHMRGFLEESGADLPPWSTSDEVMDELVALLHSHRGDTAFFARLKPFLEELREHAQRGASGLTASDAEVLSRSTVESIVEELQTRLRSAPRSASSSIIAAIVGDRAARLLCLGLLSSGLVACTDAAATATPAVPPSEPGTPAPGPIQPAAKPTTSAGGTPDELVEMFKTKSPQEVAGELERAFDAGTPTPNSKPRPNPVNKPRYKGVDFP